MAVGNQATENIDHEVGGAAMPGMLNLGDVLAVGSLILAGKPHLG
jgi:hypothetical protein